MKTVFALYHHKNDVIDLDPKFGESIGHFTGLIYRDYPTALEGIKLYCDGTLAYERRIEPNGWILIGVRFKQGHQDKVATFALQELPVYSMEDLHE